jgi:hypothetical protein
VSYEPLPVPCAGCGEPTPYEVGEGASHGEYLSTPLGLCFVRTCRQRECVHAARAAKHGRPVKLSEPPTAAPRRTRSEAP